MDLSKSKSIKYELFKLCQTKFNLKVLPKVLIIELASRTEVNIYRELNHKIENLIIAELLNESK
jgi:hypothetical protein